jgi:hypothetical protein
LLLWGGLFQAACSPPARETPTLELTQVRPNVLTDVYLNEPIRLHFSEEVDRLSVNHTSFSIATRDGLSARGERVVNGKQLSFLPDPVRSPDLLDGGYRPGTTYVVRLSGFPRPEGLGGMSGALLSRSLEFEFRTVSVADRSGGVVFVDRSPDRGEPLRLVGGRKLADGREIGPLDAIEFEGDEPLDPSTLFGEDFELSTYPGSSGVPREPVALRALLAENHDKGTWPRRGTTRVQLIPDRPLEPGVYFLRTHPGSNRLRDFGGNPIPIVPRFKIVVVDKVKSVEPPGSYKEPFLTDEMLSAGVVQGVDGAAFWSGTGRVEIRYPAAAGSGLDGEQRLRQPPRKNTVEATRLEVPSGEGVELDREPGLVVLCSQSGLEVAGSLMRESSEDPLRISEPQTLSAWLAEARRQNLNCTVLIAGGDLVISGEIRVTGPLLLVAGGRLRVSGRVIVGEDRKSFGSHLFGQLGNVGAVAVWSKDFLSDEKGGELVPRAVPLILDPPHTNPLRIPVRFGVRSRRIPQAGVVARWRGGPTVLGHAGGGSFRVRYVGQGIGPDSVEQIRDDPSLLIDCPTLRLEIELDIEPNLGLRWDPPWVDSVELGWDQPEVER